ncbi:hypothetical protein DL764_008693 [Monosporascus ibericus]|uniref:Uncharacterized protein n=1 Tax=Monosporascus ibericus TaxID=155417 RepID=A0A4Q4SWW1_9PEZI|nr:hypothetical protein DL764_008693 [Monosporascus ibericus]
MSAQSAPQAQTRKTCGPRPDEDASPPWQIFAQPSSRSQLGSQKPPHLLSHDSRADHRSPEFSASLVTPPARDKTRGSDHASSFEGRGFCPVPSLSRDDPRTSPHPLQYPPAEALVSSSYFDTAANVIVSQSLREQQMRPSGSTTDECLHRLSQLSSKLLMDFGKASSSKIGDMTPFPSLPTSTPTWHQDATNGATTSYLSSTVSKLFESLQNVWEYIDPSKQDKPVLPKPAEPTIQQIKPTASDLHIVKTIGNYYSTIDDEHDVATELALFKARAQPTDWAHEEVLERYYAVLKAPNRSKIENLRPTRHFLQAVSSINPAFTDYRTNKMEDEARTGQPQWQDAFPDGIKISEIFERSHKTGSQAPAKQLLLHSKERVLYLGDF